MKQATPAVHLIQPQGLTTALLISVVQAVGMAITQPAPGDAAGGSITAQGTLLRGGPAACLI